MSYMDPVYGEPLALSDVSIYLGRDFCTLDEPVKLTWRLSNGEWYFAVAKYYSRIGIAFERVQDHFGCVDVYPNTLIKLEDGRTWSAEGKRSEEMRASFIEFFNDIAQSQHQGAIIQDEDDDFIV